MVKRELMTDDYLLVIWFQVSPGNCTCLILEDMKINVTMGWLQLTFKWLIVALSNLGLLCCFFQVEELSDGFWDDNTALNGIRLHCIDPSKGLSSSYENYASVQSDVGR